MCACVRVRVRASRSEPDEARRRRAPYDDAVASCARTGDPDTCAGVVGQLGLEPGVDAPGGTPLAENSQTGSGRTGSVKKGTHSRAQIDFTESLSIYKMDFAG